MIILAIAAFLTNFAEIPAVQHAFAGIRVCVCVLILNAILKLRKKSVPDRVSFIVYLVVFLLTAFSALLPFAIPAAGLVIGAGIFGIFFGKSDDEMKKGGAA